MSLQVIQQAASQVLQNQTLRISIANAPGAIHKWVAANPGQSAMLVTNGFLIFTPAALTGPLLATLGFGVAGPIAGSTAAGLQSILGNVGAHSVFACLQSTAMGGYGAAIVNGAVQVFGAVSGGAVAAYSSLARRGTA